ncbi:MAG: hypothetical protein UT33_C0012G0059 [Candidatus Peregrinibacteria bacterium GW2011_GWC2_39_14]|nr:MAG: hypothetical protein US92_C0003G0086 [Candidatus Peregrinibacteria bacterium GW2011_GWA2_38_36]KKR05254.1 MAG: hypothetical protein UT33_C0012G0059 [Candidatus Peregrinibacteria bacterium GW2011_GWC2_39_14]
MRPEHLETSFFPDACRAINRVMKTGEFIAEIAARFVFITKICVGIEPMGCEKFDPRAEERHNMRNGLEL